MPNATSPFLPLSFPFPSPFHPLSFPLRRRTRRYREFFEARAIKSRRFENDRVSNEALRNGEKRKETRHASGRVTRRKVGLKRAEARVNEDPIDLAPPIRLSNVALCVAISPSVLLFIPPLHVLVAATGGTREEGKRKELAAWSKRFRRCVRRMNGGAKVWKKSGCSG